MKSVLLSLAAALLLTGCADKPAKIEVKEADGSAITASVPADAPAKTLVQLRGMVDNALTVRSERQEQAAQFALAQIQARERMQYAFYIFLAVMFGIVVLCATAMGIVVYVTRRVVSCKNSIL